jgi:hypothetical protein
MVRRQGNDFLAPRVKKRTSRDRKCVKVLLPDRFECYFELAIGVRPQDVELQPHRACGLLRISKLAG